MTDVIVFGPTGAVGSAAAREASERGAKVWLAMRDTGKKIPGLDESKGNFSRVKADLSDPASIKEAVEKSGAKSAFFYAQHTPGHMKATIQALKDSGITWVVFLSSFTVPQGDRRAVTPDNFISYLHTKIELTLEEVGLAFATVRPGYFITNSLAEKAGIQAGKVEMIFPGTKYDHIVPADIGNVAGALLVKPEPTRSPTDPHVVYLHGPELISLGDAHIKLGRAIDSPVTIDEVSVASWSEAHKGKMPPPLIKYLADQHEACADTNYYYADEVHKPAAANVEKYTGKKPTTFEQWANANKEMISAK